MSTALAPNTPSALVLLSSVGAAATLGAALWLTRPSALDPALLEAPAHATPERSAESFIDAYLAEDYARAARFATPAFAKTVKQRPKHRSAQYAVANRRWLLQESHVIRADKLRFVGVLVTPDQDESTGWPVTLTLLRRDGTFRVDELHWPKGPPSAEPR